MNQCKCGLCETVPHDSDCAVHNEPATRNGDCDCKGKIVDKQEEELDLLRNLHYQARGVLRYNGVDGKRCSDYYDRFKGAVYEVNDFNNRIDDDEEG